MPQEVKTRPLNRLQSMYALRAEVDKMYQAGEEAGAEGKPVAWVMLEGWANAILNAMDIITVFPENYSSLCAAQKLAGPFLERAETEGYPTHLCGYARACVGYSARMVELDGRIPPEAPAGGMPRPTLLVASGEVCDARFKWFQSLGRYFDAPVWTLESPSPNARESLTPGTYERNVHFLVNEIRQFVIFLAKITGKKMKWDSFFLRETALIPSTVSAGILTSFARLIQVQCTPVISGVSCPRRYIEVRLTQPLSSKDTRKCITK